jgi:hypothetical protein
MAPRGSVKVDGVTLQVNPDSGLPANWKKADGGYYYNTVTGEVRGPSRQCPHKSFSTMLVHPFALCSPALTLPWCACPADDVDSTNLCSKGRADSHASTSWGPWWSKEARSNVYLWDHARARRWLRTAG